MTNLNNEQQERLSNIVELAIGILDHPNPERKQLIQDQYEIQRAIALLKQAQEKLGRIESNG